MVRGSLLILATLTLAGCAAGPLDRLDSEAADLIGRREHLTLGNDAALDPQPAPEGAMPPLVDGRSYRETPATVNPSAANLPARPTGAATQPSTQPATTQPLIPTAIISESALHPPGALELNLEQSLAYAVEHSRDYRTRKETLFLTTLDLLIQRHLWGPIFFDTVTAQASGTPEGGDHDQVATLINQLGVTQRLPYGGTVSVSALVSFVDQLRNATGVPFNQSQSGSIVVSGTIPLLRGAGMVAREDLIQTERNLIYAARTFERSRRQFLVDVSTQYYDLIRQQAQLDNLERTLANFELVFRRLDALARAGRKPYYEVQQAQQEVLNARNNLLNAQAQYAGQLDSFKITLDVPMGQAIKVNRSEVVVPTPALDVVRSIQVALKNRLDLQTTADQVDDARRQAEVARNQTLPDLNLVANTTIPTDPNRQYGGFDLHPGAGTYAAGITFGAPLDRRVEQLKYRQALVTLERAQRNSNLARDQAAQQVRSSIRAIEQARFTLELQKRSVELAERRRLGVKLKERLLGPRDIIDAENDLSNARQAYDSAVRDLRVNILQYLLNTDQLRVTGQGQWQPPAKLVTAGAVGGLPSAMDLGPPVTQPATQPATAPAGE